MTILHLIIGLDGGGAEHMVLELANQCQNKGNKVIVVSLSNRDLILNKFNSKNIECHFLNVVSIKSLIKGLSKLKEIHSKSTDKFVFHCHMFHAFIVGFLYKVFFKNVPIVFTLHTNQVKQLYRKWILFLTKKFRSKDIIFSKNSKKWYLKNTIDIPNGVDLSKFKPIEKLDAERPFTFLFLGRLTEPKNPLFLIHIVNQLIENNHKDFIINVVGDGGLRKELETAIIKNELSNYIKLLGFQNNVSKFISEANCLIIPSLWEGMPVSIIEAGASKLPVISTPVGSIPDFLNDDNAYVTDLEKFHESMISVLTNYNEAIKKGEILFDLVKSKYDIEKVSDLHIKIYKSALN